MKINEELHKNLEKYKKIFYRLQDCIKRDEIEKGYILDSKNPKHTELKEYFKFSSFHEANTLLKIWIHELEKENIEDEFNEDAMIEFFRIRYLKIIEGIPLKGVGENL